ncbi:MAG: response regulator transcription factor [Bryobacteraceae bacterium]|nr:response regulator transcription factor [Bryobacteraceae bacterium]
MDARVLIVDDDAELVSLMSAFLSEQGFQTSAAYDGPSGLKAALSAQHDLMLLDVMMPGFDGFEVLRQLRESSEMPVLMLTARTESQSRVRGLDGGADDYLPKPFDPVELAARIRAILRRCRRTEDNGEEYFVASGVRIEPAARRVLAHGKEVELTGIEYEILDTLIRSAGHVVSRDDLMQRLYRREATPFERSIDVHISHLRKKLEGPSVLIRTIRGVGYQFVAENRKEDEA